jgi:hypothetical protein
MGEIRSIDSPMGGLDFRVKLDERELVTMETYKYDSLCRALKLLEGVFGTDPE